MVCSLFDRRSFCALLVLALALAPGQSGHAAPPEEVTVKADLPYKTGEGLTEYEQQRCHLDLYLPPAAHEAPVLVWLHGGGLTAGDKGGKKTVAVCRALAAEGMVVAAVNYRLSPKVKYPAYLEDTAAAIAWVKTHAAEHGGDPQRVYVSGHSAGGYLTGMVGLDARYLAKYQLALTDVAGLIPLSGQMMTHYTIREERGLPKTTIIADEAAPIYHAKEESAPWLILYAKHDMTLRGEENRYFAAALRAAGNQNVTLQEMPGLDHVGIGDRMAEPDSPVRALIAGFVGLRKSSSLP